MNPDSSMDPDKYQQAWQAHSAQTRVTVDADVLLKEVQRNQRQFRAMIFHRDFREVGMGILLLPLWFYLGAIFPVPWTWYLVVPAVIWMIGFFLVDRMRHKRKPSEPGEPLSRSVKESLTEVEHQIRLLRNVFWWYLLPFTIPIVIFFAHVAWQVSGVIGGHWLVVVGGAGFFVFLVVYLCATYGFVDYINQRAARTQLEPRRNELLALLANLGEDETTEEHATPSSLKSIETPRMLRRWAIVAVLSIVIYLAVALVLASGLFESSYDGPAKIDGPAGASLGKLVTDLRQEKKLVGLAAMVMVDGQVEAAAAHGQRKIGSGVPLEIGDRWHLGGITKSITATMIARLVESGQMKWSDTVGEIFPEASVHEDWKPVTLKQLLTDTAGAPPNFPLHIRFRRPPLGPERTQARRKAVLNVIADKPAYPPGKKHMYSNVGYSIAGAMAEKVTGDAWEDVVKREVFEPLGLTEAGFGPPKSADKTLEQPRGHRKGLGGKVPVDDKADNTPIMGPAGIVHMSLRDLCAYATEHLRGELGNGKLLSAETYKLLHTPALNDYACGWVVKKPTDDIRYTVYWHNGSNTMWYALVVFSPEKNTVVAVTSNDGDIEKADAAAWDIVKTSVKQLDAPRGEARQEEYPKKSPFAAVRWQQSQPEVKIGDKWFKLVSLDELPASDIVAFSQATYGEKWRKRFEEDLVELLTRMGHPSQDTVTLVVQSLTSPEKRTLEGVAMTEANRQAIRAAAQAGASAVP